jgi:hypothetical protein
MSGTVAGFTDGVTGVTGVAARDEDYGLIDFDRGRRRRRVCHDPRQ